MKKTRLFFIVETSTTNEEIFHDYESAREYAQKLQEAGDKPLAYIGTVRNAFYEEDLQGWNYDDQADTFNRLYEVDLLKVYQAHYG